MSKTNKRRRSKERFWNRIVRRWQRSGLSVRAFCRQHGIAEPSFYGWRRKLAQQEADAVPFVPVRVVPETAADGATNGNGSALELVLDEGRKLRIAPGFDAATLRRLLAVLEEGRPC